MIILEPKVTAELPPNRGQRRASRFVLQLFATLCVVGLVVLLTVVRSPEPLPPFDSRVAALDVGSDRVELDVDVFNNEPVRREFTVWASLGRFGEAPAWDRRVAVTSPSSGSARARDSARIVIDQDVSLPAGTYELTIWTEAVDDPGNVVQLTVGRPVHIADSAPVARLGPARPAKAIDDLQLQLAGGGYLAATGFVTVGPTVPSDAELRFALIRVSRDDPWWRADTADVSVVPVSGLTPLEIDVRQPVEPGVYQVRVDLAYRQIDGDEILDQVLVTEPVTIGDPEGSIRRDDLPVGAVMITSVNTTGDWSSSGEHVVTVEVESLSAEPTTIVTWWHLGSPDDPEAWKFADATSYRIERTLAPFERRTLRLSPNGELPSGRLFQLSVWVHEVSADVTKHSDGVYITSLIDIDMSNQRSGDSSGLGN